MGGVCGVANTKTSLGGAEKAVLAAIGMGGSPEAADAARKAEKEKAVALAPSFAQCLVSPFSLDGKVGLLKGTLAFLLNAAAKEALAKIE